MKIVVIRFRFVQNSAHPVLRVGRTDSLFGIGSQKVLHHQIKQVMKHIGTPLVHAKPLNPLQHCVSNDCLRLKTLIPDDREEVIVIDESIPNDCVFLAVNKKRSVFYTASISKLVNSVVAFQQPGDEFKV